MKKCWPIIKEDFVKLVNEFYKEDIMLDSINTAHITLIPKKSNPMDMNDYRPISLVSDTSQTYL
jgi:hypothetical protein